MSILFKKEISRTSGAPLGDQVKTHIRSRILNHEWEAGAKIPGEFELASQYGVARVTIRTALRSLEAQGLIDIRHGSGAYVADFGGTVRAGLQELKSITQTIKELGYKAGMVTRTSQMRPATKLEAKDLFLTAGTEVLHIEREVDMIYA